MLCAHLYIKSSRNKNGGHCTSTLYHCVAERELPCSDASVEYESMSSIYPAYVRYQWGVGVGVCGWVGGVGGHINTIGGPV